MGGIEKVTGGYKFSDETVFKIVDNLAEIRTKTAHLESAVKTMGEVRAKDKEEAKKAREDDTKAIQQTITALPVKIREGCPIFRYFAGTQHEPDNLRVERVSEFEKDQVFLRRSRKSAKYIGIVFGAGFTFAVRQKIVEGLTWVGELFKK